MPKFSSREEYEQWKKEKIKSNFEKLQESQKEEERREIPESEAKKIQPVLKQEELRPLGELFRDSWEIFKSRFWTLIALYLLSVILLVTIAGIFLGIGYLLSLLFPEHNKALLAVGALMGMIPGFIAMFWSMTAFTYAVVYENLGIRDALEKGWQKVWSFIWLFTITGFIITGGFFLLVIPGIIFAVWFIFAQFILVSEDDRGMNAVLKSKEYVKGKWFDIFLRLFVIWLIAGILGAVPFIGPILSIIYFPFMMIFIYLIYENLKVLKGKGFSYAHSSGEKLKWIGAGVLGYVVLPLLLIGILGTTLTIPLLMLKGMLSSQEQNIFIPPPRESPPFSTEPETQGEYGVPFTPEATKSEATGEALIERDGAMETYNLKTGFFSDTRFENPRRAIIEFQIPDEKHSNARRIKITLDSTRTGEHYADGKDYSIFAEDKVKIGEPTPHGLSASFIFIADGGQIFPPKDSCTINITSPYTGTPESIFDGEVNNCVVHSAGIDHTISAKFTVRGIPSR